MGSCGGSAKAELPQPQLVAALPVVDEGGENHGGRDDRAASGEEYDAVAAQADGSAEVVVKDREGRQILAKVPNGEPLRVLQVDGTQAKVRWKDIEGWIKEVNTKRPADRAEISEQPSTAAVGAGGQLQQKAIAKQSENFPEVVMKKDGGVIAKIPNGEEVTIIRQEGDESLVRWDVYEGWAKSVDLQQEVKKVRLILFGNPGKGKSALGNCYLKKLAFKSGLSYGGGLTKEVAEEATEHEVIVDTPGIADSSVDLRRAAACEVTKVLQQGGRCKVVFVVTELQSRIHDEDKTTIKLVLDAAPEIGQKYGIVVNQCGEAFMQRSRKPEWRAEFEQFFLDKLPFATRHIIYCPFEKKLDHMEDRIVELDRDVRKFLEELPFVDLTKGSSKDINAENFHGIAEQLKASKDQEEKHKEVIRSLEKQILDSSGKKAGSRRLGIQLKWVLTEFPEQCNGKARAYFTDGTALKDLVEGIRPPLAPSGTLGRQLAKHALEACMRLNDKSLESNILAKVEGDDMPFLRTVMHKTPSASTDAGVPILLDDMNFRDWAPIAAFGEKAFGKGLTCPRDDEPDCSIVDAVHSSGHSGPANFFLSWVWKYDMKTVLSALRRWQQRQDIRPEQSFLWWCFFQNNQFRILEKHDSVQATKELADIFEHQLLAVGTMLSMLNKIQGSEYLTRIWCVFEVYVASRKRVPIEIILPEDAADEVDVICKGGRESLRKATLIDVSKAKATSEDDELSIKEEIQNKASFAQVNDKASSALKASLVQIIFNEGGSRAEEKGGSDSEVKASEHKKCCTCQ